jgi:Fe2+ or Zn2+ uptake regulation protein
VLRAPMAGRPRTVRPRPARRSRATRVPDAPVERVVRVALAEEPHAHVVCRSCGRIQAIELTELDRHFLEELAGRHPDGWSVDGIAYSLTGACRRCREGPGG